MNSRNDLPAYFKELGYVIGAEIGVYKGEFTERFCQQGLKMYAIDPWITYNNYRKHPKELPYNELYENTKKLLEPYGCIIIKKTSIDALDDIPDESLDFVYIDGNHSLPYISQDIYEWSKKVKVGGTVSGHDYFNDNHNPYWIRACHVKYAVDACSKIFKTNLQILRGDKCLSWYWTKI